MRYKRERRAWRDERDGQHEGYSICPRRASRAGFTRRAFERLAEFFSILLGVSVSIRAKE